MFDLGIEERHGTEEDLGVDPEILAERRPLQQAEPAEIERGRPFTLSETKVLPPPRASSTALLTSQTDGSPDIKT